MACAHIRAPTHQNWASTMTRCCPSDARPRRSESVGWAKARLRAVPTIFTSNSEAEMVGTLPDAFASGRFAHPTALPLQAKELSMSLPHNIVVIVGNLRKEAHTLKVAHAIAKLAPDTLKLDLT